MTRTESDTQRMQDPAEKLLFLAEGLAYGSDGAIENQERDGQRQLVNSDQLPTRAEAQVVYEAVGFPCGERDAGAPMFRPATLPPGWSRKGSDHAMWSYLVDELGRERAGIFYRAAFYDRSAQSATLTLSTNDPAAPAVTVHLIGTATAAAGNAPQIKAGGIVNAASYSTTLARGSLATIFGTNLSTSTAQALPLPWAKSLGGASVTVGGVAAPLYYASPTQINFQVPYEVPAGSSANVVVTSGGVPGTATPVALADYAMGVFTYARTATAIDPIVVHYSNNQLVTPTSPAAPGEILVLYGTGVGKLNNPPPTGVAVPISPLATPVDPFTMTLGGAPVPVLFTGLTPGCAGLVQMDIQLPATLPAGSSLPDRKSTR